MGQERPFAQLASASVCLGLLLLMLPGCALLNGFLDPTDVGRFPSSYMENGIRRVLTPRDTPPGIADAEEPRPEDLVPIYEDYRIVPGDQIAVTIMNLLIQGAQWAASLEVSPTGYIRVAELGMLKVSGRTEQEVELELVERLKEADLLPNPSVQAFMQVKRNRTYMMIGSVAAPGPYPIATPDLRLLEAIGFARDVSPTVKRLYIIRQENGGVRPAETIPQDMPREDGLIIPPPDDEDIDAAASELNFFLDVAAGQEATSAPSTQQPTKSELEQIIAPKQATPPATQEGRDRPERPFAPIIFDPQTGQIVEVRPERPRAELAEPAPRSTQPQEQQPGFDWEAVPEYELAQRIIEIDIAALKRGDPRFNIVIRDRDVINVPVDTGVFYLMGEILRPGVYAFGGREITMKQAIAIGGGFGRLAWPARCEIIRRERGTDKELTIPVNLDAIFAGLEDDLLLQEDDIVNVGTHFVAPFLFVIRNSFRFTYGFGFVYDRNFADKDSFSVKQNPQSRRDVQRARQGLPF